MFSAVLRIRFLSLVLIIAASAPLARADQGAAAPPTTPQRSLPQLDTFTNLATILNLGRGAVRILAIVAPSSQAGIDVLQAIDAVMAANPSKRLRAYVILTPRSQSDTLLRAADAAARRRDRRIVCLWDPERITAPIATAPTGGADADVLFLYGTAAMFTTEAPRADLTMRSGPSAGEDRLDLPRLQARVDTLVREIEHKAIGN